MSRSLQTAPDPASVEEPTIRAGRYRNETTGIELKVTHVGRDRSGDLWWAERVADGVCAGGSFMVTAAALAECGYLLVEEPGSTSPVVATRDLLTA